MRRLPDLPTRVSLKQAATAAVEELTTFTHLISLNVVEWRRACDNE
jgi:hypothetical protein